MQHDCRHHCLRHRHRLLRFPASPMIRNFLPNRFHSDHRRHWHPHLPDRKYPGNPEHHHLHRCRSSHLPLPAPSRASPHRRLRQIHRWRHNCRRRDSESFHNSWNPSFRRRHHYHHPWGRLHRRAPRHRRLLRRRKRNRNPHFLRIVRQLQDCRQGLSPTLPQDRLPRIPPRSPPQPVADSSPPHGRHRSFSPLLQQNLKPEGLQSSSGQVWFR